MIIMMMILMIDDKNIHKTRAILVGNLNLTQRTVFHRYFGTDRVTFSVERNFTQRTCHQALVPPVTALQTIGGKLSIVFEVIISHSIRFYGPFVRKSTYVINRWLNCAYSNFHTFLHRANDIFWPFLTLLLSGGWLRGPFRRQQVLSRRAQQRA